MDPYEQRLRDEVIYLHSLWHQGPPRNPNPVLVPPAARPHFPLQHCTSSSSSKPNRKKSPNPLCISNPTTFKRESGVRRNQKEMPWKDDALAAAPEGPSGGAEWPVPKPVVDPSPAPFEWGCAKPGAAKALPTAEESARQAVMQMQYRVLNSFGEFLASSAGSDSDAADGEEDDDVGEDGGLEESEEYKFLLGVFLRDRELRDYYEKNCSDGDFCCFVCGGDRKSGKKKFKSCEGLLQHSISIARTSRRRAHRALGLVVCKVLGWDVDRLPVIMLKGEPLNLSLANSADVQCENAETASTNKSVPSSADENVENVTLRDKNGERMEEQVLDDTQKQDKISLLEKTAPEEVITQEAVEDRDEGNWDLGVSKGELADKMDPVPSSGEWPCQKVSASPNAELREWPKLPSDSSNLPVSVEEEEKIAAEQKVLEACRDFFRRKCVSECDADEEDEEDDSMMGEDNEEEEEDDDYEDGESEEYKFFMKLFMEDAKLRAYYEKCSGDGDFLCLACAGVGKKTWRRFRGCIGLLHHSSTVWKTKKKAHRAYARAVCKVRGWDIDQFPKIVCIAEPLSSSLVGSAAVLGSVPLPTSDAQWPCEDIKDGSHQQTSEWPNPKLPSDSVDDSISAEEKEKVAAEQKILEACRDFFHRKYGSEFDGDAEEGGLMDEVDEEEEEGEDEDESSDGECEEFKFFIKLFAENANLRSYYENSHVDGDFLCLVCGAVNKKTWRRFKGCIGLLHHSNTLWKIKKKAHRAYARAVCKVLGWDIERLPRMVAISEPRGQSTAGTESSVPLADSGAEWPCQDFSGAPDSPPSKWPDLDRPSEPVSAEEKEKLAADQKVLEACRDFFLKKYGPELDEDGDDEEGEDLMDEDNEAEEVKEEQDKMDGDPYGNSEEFEFFVKLFTEDEKLRSFYGNNHGSGDFCCLVCAAVGKKVWKRFKGCAGLLSHSNTVLETAIKAHRAYTRAVCRVFGWDFEQLPKIVTIAEPLSRSFVKSDGLQGAVKVKDDTVPPNSENKENC